MSNVALAGCRILVVEDEVLIGMVLEDILDMLGCTLAGMAATMGEAHSLAGDLTIEEAVHVQTGKQAQHFNFTDRGVIAPGYKADIAVFDLDEVETRPLKRVFDVPDGEGGMTWRFSRDAAPMRLTLVNGVPTFENGQFTEAFPGKVIGPTITAKAAAEAA